MKNEPVVSYNHMQEERPASEMNERIPFTLYLLLFIDAILISVISVFVARLIF